MTDIGSVFKEKRGRATGAIIGFVIGVLIIFPKIFILVICVAVGYFIGRYFDEKNKVGAAIEKGEGHGR